MGIIGCFFRFCCQFKSDGKSPTPSSITGTEPPTPSPAPYQPFLQRCESQERRWSSSLRRASSSLFPSRTLERRVSGPHPPYSPLQDSNRLTSSLSHLVIPSSPSSPSVAKVHDSDEERGGFGLSLIHPLPMSYSSTSTLSDSVVTTPAFVAFPLHAESQVHSSPRTTAFLVVIESSSSTSPAGSEPPTRPSSPDNSSSIEKVLPAHKYTSNAPAPLLRINKRIPSCGCIPDLAIFPPSFIVVDSRVFLFSISIFFHERYVAESNRHPKQPSASFSRNSKQISLLCVILIILVQPTFIS